MEIKIGWLFPDTCYLHGERGNILALERMGENLGHEVVVEKIDFDTEDFTPSDYDMLFMGPGEISSFPTVLEFLRDFDLALTAFIKADNPLLVTGTSLALWGNEIVRTDGSVIRGLGVVDMVCKENTAVYGDDLYFSATVDGQELEIIGNQIQMMDVELGEDAPFGTVKYGYGNDGKGILEGLQDENAVFTNCLGPILVTNPWLTEALLRIILKNHEEPADFPAGDYQLERDSFASKKKFIQTKETKLTNTTREG